MKRFILTFAIFSATVQFAAGYDDDYDVKNFNTYFMVSVQPRANWFYYSGPYLDYQIKPSLFTTVELGLKYKDWLSLFFGFDYNYNDNYVGQIIDSKAFSRIIGKLGIKNFAIHAAFGQMEGTATWKGPPVPGQPETANIETKYTEVALMYVFKAIYSMFSLGLIYINYTLPMSFSYAYQDSMSLNYYGVYFQQSGFRAQMEKLRTESKNGFGFKNFGLMLDQNLSIGIAYGEINAETRRRNRFGYLINPGSADPNEAGTLGFSGTWQIIAGVCGGININKVFLGFGAGYDGFIQFYAAEAIQSSLIRHGFTLRSFLSF